MVFESCPAPHIYSSYIISHPFLSPICSVQLLYLGFCACLEWSILCYLLGVELPLIDLFHVTVRSFTKTLKTWGAHQNLSMPIPPGDAEGARELSFAQERLVSSETLEGPSAVYNMPFAFHLAGSLNVADLQYALNELVNRYPALRTCFLLNPQGHTLQQVQPPKPFQLQLLPWFPPRT